MVGYSVNEPFSPDGQAPGWPGSADAAGRIRRRTVAYQGRTRNLPARQGLRPTPLRFRLPQLIPFGPWLQYPPGFLT
jgi:hypothetical protein